MNQIELFNQIWEEREHISEVSGRPLLPKGHFQWHWQFCHILNKGQYTKWKFNKDNIMLMLPEEHAIQERFPIFQEKFQELKARYNEEFRIKRFN